jgi:hypothetical protein
MYPNARKYTSTLFASIVLSVLFAASSAVAADGEPERVELGPIGECALNTGGATDTLDCSAETLPDNETASLKWVRISTDDKQGQITDDKLGGGEVQVLELPKNAYPVDLEVRAQYRVAGQRVTQEQTWTVDERPGGGWSKEIPALFDLVGVVFWPHKTIGEEWSAGSFGVEAGSSLKYSLAQTFSGEGDVTGEVSYEKQKMYSGKDDLASGAGQVVHVPVPAEGSSGAEVTVVREGPNVEKKREVTSTVEGAGYYLIKPDASVEQVDAGTAKSNGVEGK